MKMLGLKQNFDIMKMLKSSFDPWPHPKAQIADIKGNALEIS